MNRFINTLIAICIFNNLNAQTNVFESYNNINQYHIEEFRDFGSPPSDFINGFCVKSNNDCRNSSNSGTSTHIMEKRLKRIDDFQVEFLYKIEVISSCQKTGQMYYEITYDVNYEKYKGTQDVDNYILEIFTDGKVYLNSKLKKTILNFKSTQFNTLTIRKINKFIYLFNNHEFMFSFSIDENSHIEKDYHYNGEWHHVVLEKSLDDQLEPSVGYCKAGMNSTIEFPHVNKIFSTPSNQDVTVSENISKIKVWAICVGVSDYSTVLNDEGLNDLTFCHVDAEKVKEFLHSPEGGAIPSNQISLLTNANATKDNILNECSRLYTIVR
jgi:hypothetical protein